MKKYFLAIIASLGVFLLIYFVNRSLRVKADPQKPLEPLPITVAAVRAAFDQSLIKFNAPEGKPLIIEISDPSCFFCRMAAGAVKAVGGPYTPPEPQIRKLAEAGQVNFAYIYFPGNGKLGETAMKALYCANERGRFWEIHDLIMENKPVPGDLQGCVSSDKYNQRLKDDAALADKLGVDGTPWFFINDRQFAGAYSWADLSAVLY